MLINKFNVELMKCSEYSRTKDVWSISNKLADFLLKQLEVRVLEEINVVTISCLYHFHIICISYQGF